MSQSLDQSTNSLAVFRSIDLNELNNPHKLAIWFSLLPSYRNCYLNLVNDNHHDLSTITTNCQLISKFVYENQLSGKHIKYNFDESQFRSILDIIHNGNTYNYSQFKWIWNIISHSQSINSTNANTNNKIPWLRSKWDKFECYHQQNHVVIDLDINHNNKNDEKEQEEKEEESKVHEAHKTMIINKLEFDEDDESDDDDDNGYIEENDSEDEEEQRKTKQYVDEQNIKQKQPQIAVKISKISTDIHDEIENIEYEQLPTPLSMEDYFNESEGNVIPAMEDDALDEMDKEQSQSPPISSDLNGRTTTNYNGNNDDTPTTTTKNKPYQLPKRGTLSGSNRERLHTDSVLDKKNGEELQFLREEVSLPSSKEDNPIIIEKEDDSLLHHLNIVKFVSIAQMLISLIFWIWALINIISGKDVISWKLPFDGGIISLCGPFIAGIFGFKSTRKYYGIDDDDEDNERRLVMANRYFWCTLFGHGIVAIHYALSIPLATERDLQIYFYTFTVLWLLSLAFCGFVAHKWRQVLYRYIYM